MPGPPQRRQPHQRLAAVIAGLVAAAGVAAAASGQGTGDDLATVLLRVGERVQQYFARAQHLVCLESVHLQPLGTGLSPTGLGRNVVSELQMSWEAPAPGAAVEARMRRQVLTVNGGKPRKRDPNNCTVPEQYETEQPALAMLLPDGQREYTFSLAGRGRVGRREAIQIDYREIARLSVEVETVPDNEECVNFDMTGGIRGRIWVDPATYEVLRLDQGLIGLVEVPLPRRLLLRAGGLVTFVMERWDTSIRFEPRSFQDPEETLTLPVAISSLRITRGSASPRLRTTTEFTQYRRFLTGGRVVPPS